MALKKQMCSNHADRIAIGVCVITRQPICSECSTRYEGVNYSKEGLEILRERRAGEQQKAQRSSWTMNTLGLLLSPLFFFLLFQAYRLASVVLIDIRQLDFGAILEDI